MTERQQLLSYHLNWLSFNMLNKLIDDSLMHRARGGDRGSGSPQENHENIGFLSYTGPDPLQIHKIVKPAFSVGPY